MNRNYKVIWNRSLGCFTAVAEYAKSQGKSSSSAVTSNASNTNTSSSVTTGARLMQLSALCVGMALTATSMQASAVIFTGDAGSTQSNDGTDNRVSIIGDSTIPSDASTTNIQVAVDGASRTIAIRLTDTIDLSAIGKLTVGNSVLANNGLTLTDTNGDGTSVRLRVVNDSSDSQARLSVGSAKIVGVEDGEIGATSRQAINGRQLFATEGRVTDNRVVSQGNMTALGGSYDSSTNAYTAPTYNVVSNPSGSATGYRTVGEALTALNDAVQTPLTFKGDDGTTTRKLGQTLSVKGGADTSELSTGNNIGVVADNSDGSLTVKLAKELTGLTSATFGDVVISSSGLDNGQNKITNVSAGDIVEDGLDAVNGGQLFTVQTAAAAAQTTADLGFAISAANGDTIQKNLGQAVKIVGSNSNLNTTVNTDGNLEVALNNTLDLSATGSLTVGNSVLKNNSLAIGNGLLTQTSLTLTDGTNAAVNIRADSVGTEKRLNVGDAKITNVADGTVSAGSKQAITGRQLFRTNSKVDNNTTALGGSYDPVSGVYTAPSYELDGGTNTFNTVGGALGNLDNRTTANTADIAQGIKLGDGNSANDQQLALGDTINVLGGSNLTTTASAAGVTVALNNTVDLTSAGSLTVGNSVLADNGLTLNNATGDSVRIRAGNVTGEKRLNVDGAKIVGVADGDISSATSQQAVNGGQLFATNTDITNLQNGTSGLVQQANNTAPVTVAANSGGTDVNFRNNLNEARILRGVADGNLAATSEQAVNGRQLFSTNTNVAGNTTALGGNARYDSLTGVYTQPTYDIVTNNAAGTLTTTGYNTVGEALAALNGSVQAPITFAGDTGTDVTRQLGQKLSITGGETDTTKLATGNNIGVTANGSDGLLVQLAKDIDLSAAGSLTVGNSLLNNSGLKLTSGIAGAQAVQLTAGVTAGEARLNVNGAKIVGVANATLDANSQQAVAGNQLFATNNLIADLTNGTTGIVREDNVTKALEIGSTANASGDNSIAMGVGAIASGNNSISIGTGNEVIGANSGAIGDPTTITGNNSYSLGNDNTITGNRSFTIGNDNTISGNRSSTLGSDNTISSNNAFALGNRNTINSNNAFALGNDITIGTGLNGAVGIGNNTDVAASTVASFAPTGSTVAGTTFGNNVVSIGSFDSERRLTNVAAGGADTDAVNVSQLRGVDVKAQGNAAALGGNVAGGVYSPPQYVVFTNPSDIGATGIVVNNVGAAFTAINQALQTPLTFTGDTGTATRQLGSTLSITGGATGNLTTGNIGVEADETGGLVVKLAETIDLGVAGSVTTGNTVTNNSGVSIDDTTGNVTALTATGTSVTDNVNTSNYGATGFTTTDGTNTTTFDKNGLSFANAGGATGPSITASGIDAGNQQITGVASGGVITDVNNALNAANIGDISSAVSGVTTLGFGITAADGNTVQKDLGEVVEIIGSSFNSNITTKVVGGKVEIELDNDLDLSAGGSLTIGNSVLNNTSLVLGNGTDSARLTVDARGFSVNQSRIVDLADGNIAFGSQQAVNGGQIFGISTSIANNLGGGSVVNTNGTISAPSYSLDSGTVTANNVGAALDNLDGRVTDNAGNIAANSSAIDNLNNGTAGIVQQVTDSSTGEITIAVGKDTGGTTVDFSNVNGDDRVLTGVANGDIAAGSNDAVTGDQLFGTAGSITSIIGGNATLGADGKITTTDIGGTGKNTIDAAIGAVKTAAEQAKSTVSAGSNVTVTATPAGSPGPIDYEVSVNPNITLTSVTTGNTVMDTNGVKVSDATGSTTITTSGTSIVNAAGDSNNSTATGNTIANSTNTSNYGANGFTATDAAGNNGTVVNQTGISFTDNAGVSTGPSITAGGINAGGKVVTGVADGIGINDAVNFGQLSAVEKRLGDSVNSLGYKIGEVEDDANAGISAAMAMSSLPQAFIPGKSMLGGGIATYNGESAVAVGLSRVSDNGRWVMKINGTADTQGNAGGSVGAGFQF